MTTYSTGMRVSVNGKDWYPAHAVTAVFTINPPETLPFSTELPAIRFTAQMTRRAMQRAIRLLGGHHGMRRAKRRARKRRGK